MNLEMVMPERMYAVVDFRSSIVIFAIGVAVAVIATLYIAYQSTKYNPAEVLRS